MPYLLADCLIITNCYNSQMRLCFLLSLLLASCSGWKTNPSSNPQNRSLSSQSSSNEAQSCSELTEANRKLILQLASPEYFQKTRYRKSPRYGRNIERETDCSSFVHEVYRRSVLPFQYRSSRDLKDAPEFKVIEEDKALPGDIMLFRGHVGILADDGKIISATLHRKKKNTRTLSSEETHSVIRKVDKKFFPGVHIALRYKCTPSNSLAGSN